VWCVGETNKEAGKLGWHGLQIRKSEGIIERDNEPLFRLNFYDSYKKTNYRGREKEREREREFTHQSEARILLKI